jgi:hypothetical protein
VRASGRVWLRRILFSLSAVAIAVAVTLAFKPMDLSSGFITSGGADGRFLLADSSCGPPVVDAFQGTDTRWGLPIAGSSSDGSEAGGVVTCRSEARSRLKLSVVALLGGILLGVVALRLRRRSDDDGVALAPT